MAVLTAVLPSALAKAANMEPVRFASVASAVGGVHGERVVDREVADTHSRSRDDFRRVEVLDAVPLDRDHLPYFRKSI